MSGFLVSPVSLLHLIGVSDVAVSYVLCRFVGGPVLIVLPDHHQHRTPESTHLLETQTDVSSDD